MNIPTAIRFPSIALSDALRFGDQLYKNAGRTPVEMEVGVKALGYTSLNGAARNTMSALSSYGIISKVGGGYRISDAFLKVARPVSEQDKNATMRSMALHPPLFHSIYSEHRECNEQVLVSLLVHKGLAEDSAKKAARIYRSNAVIAKLDEAPQVPSSGSTTEASGNPELPFPESNQQSQPVDKSPSRVPVAILQQNVLAQYSIPLGGNEATLVFTGKTLVPDDFDALAEYVLLFKKQFERRQKSTPPTPDPEELSSE